VSPTTRRTVIAGACFALPVAAVFVASARLGPLAVAAVAVATLAACARGAR
jgi:hypothetical protein